MTGGLTTNADPVTPGTLNKGTENSPVSSQSSFSDTLRQSVKTTEPRPTPADVADLLSKADATNAIADALSAKPPRITAAKADAIIALFNSANPADEKTWRKECATIWLENIEAQSAQKIDFKINSIAEQRLDLTGISDEKFKEVREEVLRTAFRRSNLPGLDPTNPEDEVRFQQLLKGDGYSDSSLIDLDIRNRQSEAAESMLLAYKRSHASDISFQPEEYQKFIDATLRMGGDVAIFTARIEAMKDAQDRALGQLKAGSISKVGGRVDQDANSVDSMDSLMKSAPIKAEYTVSNGVKELGAGGTPKNW